jgi:transposase InsO family protein
VFIDIFEFPAAYNGRRYLLLITDEFSGMMFSWSLTSKPEVSNIIKDFEARIKPVIGMVWSDLVLVWSRPPSLGLV